jgi:hypothetical protein
MRACLSFALALALAASTAGCTRRATQLIVVVETDLPRDAYACFGLLVSRVEGGAVEPGATRRFLAVPSDVTAPFSFAVTPPGGRASARVEVAVEALDSCDDPGPDERVVRRAVRTGFVEEQALRLSLFLPASCGDGCTATESCPAIGPDCVPVPTFEPSELTPVTPGSELVDAASAIDGGAPELDAGSDAASSSSDAFVAREDAGPPPPCDSVTLTSYFSGIWVPPMAVAPRHLASAFTVISSNGSVNAISEAVESTLGSPLFDESGFGSAMAASEISMHGLAGTDSVFVVASVGADVLYWERSGATNPATRVATGALRPGRSCAPLGGDTLVAIEQGGMLAFVRAPSGTAVGLGPLALREVSLAPSGSGGALVALAEGAAPSECALVVLDAAGSPLRTIAAPTGGGPCESVGAAALTTGEGILAFVADGALWYRHVDLDAGTTGAPFSLGPALAGHVGLWPDAMGGFRAVWRADTEELRSVTVTAMDVQGRTTCLGDGASTAVDYTRATSARAGATTMILVPGGGRSGLGALYATLSD